MGVRSTTILESQWKSEYRINLIIFVRIYDQYFIPLVLGGMALYIFTDIFHRVTVRRRQRQAEISGSEGQSE